MKENDPQKHGNQAASQAMPPPSAVEAISDARGLLPSPDCDPAPPGHGSAKSSASDHLPLQDCWYAGPALLGLSVGLQWMMIALVLVGPGERTEQLVGTLTILGKWWLRPEHDITIYLAGLALTTLITALLVIEWQSLVRRVGAAERFRFVRVSAVLQALLGIGSLFLFFVLLTSRYQLVQEPLKISGPARQPHGLLDVLIILIPSIGALTCGFWDTHFGCFPRMKAGKRLVPRLKATWLARCITELAAPLIIALIVMVPPYGWKLLSGQFFLVERMHHWNFFAMGPALRYSHGWALCSEAYTQYGIGWPLMFSGFHQQPTYAAMIATASLYGVVYFVGVYWLARRLLGKASWAAVAALMAVLFQLCSGLEPGDTIWRYPSSTFMRHPVDVWFFLTLLAASNSGRRIYYALAGILSGSAIAFVADSGLALTATFAIYLFGRSLEQAPAPRGGRKLSVYQTTTLFLAALASTLFLFAAWANHWHFPGGSYWMAWIQGLRGFVGRGLGFRPVSGVESGALLLFLGALIVYLMQILRFVIGLRNRRAQPEMLIIACISVYGLALLSLFVGRSVPENIYHFMVPLAIVFTEAIMLISRPAIHTGSNSSIPVALLFMVLISIVSKPEFLGYPSALQAIFRYKPQGGADLCPGDLQIPVIGNNQLQTATAETLGLSRLMATAKKADQRVVVLSPEDTVLYYISGTEPWSRYPTIIESIYTGEELRTQVEQLHRDLPMFVIIQEENVRKDSNWEDIWAAFFISLPKHYEHRETIGSMGVWVRKH